MVQPIIEFLIVWKLSSVFITAPGIILSTIVMGSISLISSIWDRSGHTQHRIAQAWARMLLKLGFMQCTVTGLEKLDPSRSYVLVCNHASYMDTPVILSVLPLQFRFFATIGLFSIPFMGWHLSRAGHIPVARDNVRASLKSSSTVSSVPVATSAPVSVCGTSPTATTSRRACWCTSACR